MLLHPYGGDEVVDDALGRSDPSLHLGVRATDASPAPSSQTQQHHHDLSHVLSSSYSASLYPTQGSSSFGARSVPPSLDLLAMHKVSKSSQQPISTSPDFSIPSSLGQLPEEEAEGPATGGRKSKSGRPFQCDQCDLGFNRNHDLRRHQRIHLDIRPYACDKCSKAFSRKDALRRHWMVKGCRGDRDLDEALNAISERIEAEARSNRSLPASRQTTRQTTRQTGRAAGGAKKRKAKKAASPVTTDSEAEAAGQPMYGVDGDAAGEEDEEYLPTTIQTPNSGVSSLASDPLSTSSAPAQLPPPRFESGPTSSSAWYGGSSDPNLSVQYGHSSYQLPTPSTAGSFPSSSYAFDGGGGASSGTGSTGFSSGGDRGDGQASSGGVPAYPSPHLPTSASFSNSNQQISPPNPYYSRPDPSAYASSYGASGSSASHQQAALSPTASFPSPSYGTYSTPFWQQQQQQHSQASMPWLPQPQQQQQQHQNPSTAMNGPSSAPAFQQGHSLQLQQQQNQQYQQHQRQLSGGGFYSANLAPSSYAGSYQNAYQYPSYPAASQFTVSAPDVSHQEVSHGHHRSDPFAFAPPQSAPPSQPQRFPSSSSSSSSSLSFSRSGLPTPSSAPLPPPPPPAAAYPSASTSSSDHRAVQSHHTLFPAGPGPHPASAPARLPHGVAEEEEEEEPVVDQPEDRDEDSLSEEEPDDEDDEDYRE